ncbi:hypothetical protein GCM10022261_11990 [Brevibacterium daeguense]|uniref:Phosphomevalonate dehydratase small subunit-like domain-containing protein n=1 Tax=Brevibacterium daeguense TaxID=909936 RepID=A0ABP8EI87_9MICO
MSEQAEWGGASAGEAGRGRDRPARTDSGVRARVLHPGTGEGPVLVIEPVSFWGGVDEHGTISDVHHPHCGTSISGTVLVLPASKGSSSGSSVLAELIMRGRAPAAIIVTEPDAIIVSGCLAAAEIGGAAIPVAEVAREDWPAVRTAARAELAFASVEIGEYAQVDPAHLG